MRDQEASEDRGLILASILLVSGLLLGVCCSGTAFVGVIFWWG